MLSYFGHVQLFAALQTVARWAALSMGLSRQEYWSGLQCPPSRDLLDPGIKPTSPTSPAWTSGSSLVAQMEKNLAGMWETQVGP